MSSGTSRRDQDVERTRQLILDAARDVFVSSGYDAASIREVARRAGISHGTIYLHFRDKDDLLYQVSEDDFTRLISRLRALPRTQDPIQRLSAALREVGGYGLEFPHQYELMIGQRIMSPAAEDESGFGPMAEQLAGFLGDLIREAEKRGFVPNLVGPLNAIALIAGIHGVVSLHSLRLIDRDTAIQAIDHTTTLLVSTLTGGACEVQLLRSNAVDCEHNHE